VGEPLALGQAGDGHRDEELRVEFERHRLA